MELFKASRVAVREALKSLEASGLVIIKPGSGTFVAQTDYRTMRDSLYSIMRIQNIPLDEITEARLIFEPHVARLAAERIAGEDILLLEENIRNTEAVLTTNRPSTTENIEFHSLVAGSAHNTVISLAMKTLLDVARAMTIETSDNVQERYAISLRSHGHHQNILEALRAKDVEGAYKLMSDHIKEIQDALRGAILANKPC